MPLARSEHSNECGYHGVRFLAPPDIFGIIVNPSTEDLNDFLLPVEVLVNVDDSFIQVPSDRLANEAVFDDDAALVDIVNDPYPPLKVENSPPPLLFKHEASTSDTEISPLETRVCEISQLKPASAKFMLYDIVLSNVVAAPPVISKLPKLETPEPETLGQLI